MLRTRPATAVLAGVLPALAFAPVLTPGIAARTAQTVSSSFQLRIRHHYGPAGNGSGYSAIVGTGKKAAWVFGGTNPGGPSVPVAGRWNGAALTRVRLPARLTGFITDASAPSAHDVWAASQYGGYVLHWNGKRWSLARHWRGGEITGLTAITSSDVWVFGTTSSGATGIGTWHYNGRSWQKAGGRARAIFRASAVSRRDIWAIGASSRAGWVQHFNGSSWRRVRAGHLFAHLQLRDILAVSRQNVWVVGNTFSSSGATRVVLAHWNGHGWRKVLTRKRLLAGHLANGRNGIVLLTATPAGLSAMGMIIQASPRGLLAVTTIRSGQGSGVSDVALRAGTREIWASGGILTPLGGDAAIWTGPLARPAAEPDLDSE